ncbi:helix-turn-helix transcriptional regulator [Populibacterium corticicola]|uniref:Helix-turn-helix transcriptional regulator n=1 Tax=Populibacterium corticicola TaxID=1812826 RepID=A0ABW5XBP7_9MICO
MRIQTPADLARTVKTQRQAQDLTQQEVADAVGITRQSLARIERGHGGTSFDTILRILEKLGVQLEATPQESRGTITAASGHNSDTLREVADALRPLNRASIAPHIDTSKLVPSVNLRVGDLTRQLRELAEFDTTVISGKTTRRALLDSVIEASDPDRIDSVSGRKDHSEEKSGEIAND